MVLSNVGPFELVLLGGAVCSVLGILLAAVAVAGLIFIWMRRRPSRDAYEEALEGLGYQSAGPSQWSMPLHASALVFDERTWRWSIRLPRYNTLTLHIEERTSGRIPKHPLFESEVGPLDERFLMGSGRAAQTVALVRNREVGTAMLSLPSLSLELHGDELIVSSTRPSGQPDWTRAGIAAERELHHSVMALVVAIFGCLYAKETGTLLPEHR
jgi:hypothetical protein